MTTHRLDEMAFDEAYALLTRVVQPRPIAFVSTLSITGVPNLAPFSFFMAGGSNPPSVCFSPTLDGRGEEKDSLRNARETGEFVVNTVDRSMAGGMNATSAALGPHESEWGLSGFSPLESEVVRPSRVAESLAQMECRLFEIVAHGNGPSAARYVIGEVVRLHLRDEAFESIARLGGSGYLDAATRRALRPFPPLLGDENCVRHGPALIRGASRTNITVSSVRHAHAPKKSPPVRVQDLRRPHRVFARRRRGGGRRSQRMRQVEFGGRDPVGPG